MGTELQKNNEFEGFQNLVERIREMQKVMKTVMKKGVDYGLVPGCPKPSLFKPGAEKLLTTFGIAVDVRAEDLSGSDEVRYRTKVVGFRNGVEVGTGVGECSTNEERYKWRRMSCIEEWDATPETRRRIKFRADRSGNVTQEKQVRTEPSDQANTVLKMSKKRALCDMCLTTLGASDIFTQDLGEEDEEKAPQGARSSGAQKPAASKPKAPAAVDTTGKEKIEAPIVQTEARTSNKTGNSWTDIYVAGDDNPFSCWSADMGKRATSWANLNCGKPENEMKPCRMLYVTNGKYRNVEFVDEPPAAPAPPSEAAPAPAAPEPEEPPEQAEMPF